MLKVINYIFDFVVLFGFLFTLIDPITGMVEARLVCATVAVVYIIFHLNELNAIWRVLYKKNIYRALLYFSICAVFIIMSSLLYQHVDGNFYFKIQYFIYIILYVFVFPIYCVIRFKNSRYFTFVITSVFITQAVIVLMASVNTSFRMVLFDYLYSDSENIFEERVENGSRIFGLGLMGSAGSIVCCTFSILLTYMFLKKKLGFIPFIILFSVNLMTTMFIGRTGVILEIVLLIYVILSSPGKIASRFLFAIPFALFFIYILMYTLNSADSGNGDTLFAWMMQAFSSEDRRSVSTMILNQQIPHFSPEYIIGTGVMDGVEPSGDRIRCDSGYVMIYGALGIVGAILLYMAFLNLFKMSGIFKKSKKVIRNFYILIIILAYAIEYKEPFMTKYVFPFMIVVVSLFEINDITGALQTDKMKKNKSKI